MISSRSRIGQSLRVGLGIVLGVTSAQAQSETESVPPEPATPAPVTPAPITPAPVTPAAIKAESKVEAALQAGVTWVGSIYERSVTSLVRIECGDAVGSGFFFHSERHIATAFHVVSSGRDITVVLVDGRQVEARVVAWDPGQDLAILEVAGETRGSPLLPAGGAPRVGDPALAIGVPMDFAVRQAHRAELPVFTVTVGTISAVTAEAVQTDAAINPGNSGGPLLDPRGRVLGVVSSKVADGEGLGFAVPMDRLVLLTKEIDPTSNFLGYVAGDVEIAYGRADHGLDGLQLGLRLILFDRLGLGLRGAWLSSERHLANELFLQHRSRSLVELAAFYRFSFYASPYLALHLPLGVGFASTHDEIERTRFVATLDDAACDLATDDCVLLTSGQRSTAEEGRFRPMAMLDLELPPLILSSALYFEQDEPLGWRFGIGLAF